MGTGSAHYDFLTMSRQRCPHCLELSVFREQKGSSSTTGRMFDDPFSPDFEIERSYHVSFWKCELCYRPVVWLLHMSCEADRQLELIYPLRTGHPPVPRSAPEEIGALYEETCRVARVSGTATVVLVRRTLQLALRIALSSAPTTSLQRQIHRAKDLLSPQTYACLQAMKILGDAGAHPNEEARNNGVIAISTDEASLVVDVLHDVIVDLFERPDTAHRLQRLAESKRAKDLRELGMQQ